MVSESQLLNDLERSVKLGKETKTTYPATRPARDMGALIEKHYPWLLGLITAVVCARLIFRMWALPPGTKDLFTATLNVAAIAVGFLFTAKSILISIDNRWIIQRGKESGAYQMLIAYMLSATYWWLITAVLSGIGLAILPAGLKEAQKVVAIWCFSGWVFFAATANIGGT